MRIRGSWPGIFVAMASTSSIPENYEDQRQKRIEKNNTILSKLLPGITCQRKKKVVSPAPSPPTPPLEIKHESTETRVSARPLTGLPIARKRLNMGRKRRRRKKNQNDLLLEKRVGMTYHVRGQTGTLYKVTRDRTQGLRCQCRRFRDKKYCDHTTFIRNKCNKN